MPATGRQLITAGWMAAEYLRDMAETSVAAQTGQVHVWPTDDAVEKVNDQGEASCPSSFKTGFDSSSPAVTSRRIDGETWGHVLTFSQGRGELVVKANGSLGDQAAQ